MTARESRDKHGANNTAYGIFRKSTLFSKAERGDRSVKPEQVMQLANYFHTDENELPVLWIAGKVPDAVKSESGYTLRQDTTNAA